MKLFKVIDSYDNIEGRKRMISIKLLILKILDMIKIKNKIKLPKSKKILKKYEDYWKLLMQHKGVRIKNIINDNNQF